MTYHRSHPIDNGGTDSKVEIKLFGHSCFCGLTFDNAAMGGLRSLLIEIWSIFTSGISFIIDQIQESLHCRNATAYKFILFSSDGRRRVVGLDEMADSVHSEISRDQANSTSGLSASLSSGAFFRRANF